MEGSGHPRAAEFLTLQSGTTLQDWLIILCVVQVRLGAVHAGV